MSSVLGGILSYFGAKREMAPQIVAHFGPHMQYWEPFSGSLSVLLAKPECRHEIVSEKNPDVANLLRCLSDETQSLWLWSCASRFPVSETAFQEAAGRLAEPMTSGQIGRGTPSRALDFLLVSWQGPSGLAGTTRKPRFAVRNTTTGGTVAARWKAVAESIPDWHERLRNVEFRCKDAFELMDAVPDQCVTLAYLDPPYTFDSRTAGRYAHDFTAEDHERLAAASKRFTRTKVVVSLYDSPEANRLYAGWAKVPVAAPRKLGHTTGGTQDRVEAGEVLFINRV